MALPAGASRIVTVLAAGVVVVAASARPPLPAVPRAVLVLAIAFVAAWSARSALLLLAARRGVLVVERGAPTHRLSRACAGAGLVAVALAAPLLALPLAWARTPLLAAGALGIGAGALLARRRDHLPKGPRPTTKMAWLLVDTALPAAVLAALLGVSVAFLRLHDVGEVSPGALGRHLGGTVFLYALFLGLGGVAKAHGERAAGLVLVDDVTLRAPGPVSAGGLLGLALLFAVPALAPAVPLETVLVVKAAVGFLVGGALSFLGALQGCRLPRR